MTHTPTPWFAGEPYCDEDIGNCIAVSIGPFAAKNHYEDTIAEAWSGNHDAEANADFIVTAVNSHEDLLEALEGAAKTCHICDGKGSHTLMDETEICQSPGSSRQDCQFCAPYRAAIKAAQ